MDKPIKERSRLFDSLILSSWWVILFVLSLFFLYDQAIQKRKREEHALQTKYAQLAQEREEALAHVDELRLRQASQDDPDWIEMVLREKLGLVAEGETKVLFR